MPRKETRRRERRKNGSGHRVIDARMGVEETNRKRKEEQNSKAVNRLHKAHSQRQQNRVRVTEGKVNEIIAKGILSHH